MSQVVEMKKRFAIWTVGGKDYTLKLSTTAIVMLEEKIGANLLKVVMTPTVLPKLKDMLLITHQAMLPFEPDIKLEDVYKLFDTYVESGGSQADFFAGPFTGLWKASGFLSDKKTGENPETLTENSLENAESL